MFKSYNLIFMGTPEFALVILRKLVAKNWLPKVVVTQPDKLVGRKQKLQFSPVKQFAVNNNISVLQPTKLKGNQEFFQKIRDLKPDLIIIAAYGKIIPKDILDIPRFGCLNVHASLLPKYCGSSPIQYAILNGEKETGVTIMLVDEKMDHGPIIANSKFKIQNSKITCKDLGKDLAELGANLLVKVIPKWLNNKIKPIPQDHTKATFTKIIKKEDGLIDWNQSAEQIEKQIRAFYPWPTAFSKIKMKNEFKTLKIFRAKIYKTEKKELPGKIFLINQKMAVTCGKDCLILEEVQLEGKKIMTASDFLRGHPQIIGITFYQH